MWVAWLGVVAAHVLEAGSRDEASGGFRGSFAALTKDAVLAYLEEQYAGHQQAVLQEAAELTSSARSRSYAQSVPDDVFKEYVAPPTVLDEPSRVGVRSHLRSLVDPILVQAGPRTVDQAAEAVLMKLGPSLKLKFIGDSTPQIMSPQAVLEHGGASCTGLSVFFTAALRSAGIPARVAGTPYWHGDHGAGNHDWIEVYTGKEGCKDNPRCDGWSFIEAPFDGNFTRGALHRPCENWFCTPEKIGKHSGTETYATHFVNTGVSFPMTWNSTDKSVFAEARNDYYEHACGACGFE